MPAWLGIPLHLRPVRFLTSRFDVLFHRILTLVICS